eukprot:m51a1_g3465 putative protein phosphatase 2a scaffold subunit (590) ;mRNA; f:735591-737992
MATPMHAQVDVIMEDENSAEAVQALLDRLKNEDVQLRLTSVRRLGVIAKKLRPERTRAELIPFLSESLDDEDEVLGAIAEQLGAFVEHVGGPEHAACLIPPLEQLAAAEEMTVRDKATAALNGIGLAMPQNMFDEHFVGLAKRLGAREWFTSRASAAALLPTAHQRGSDASKRDVRALFVALSKDDTPTVRRAVANAFPAFAGLMAPDVVRGELLQTFLRMAQDEQDSVRLMIVDVATALAAMFSAAEIKQHVLPVVLSFTRDKSWRVRYQSADHFVSLCKAMGSVDELVGSFEGLLQDTEAEVRTAAATHVSDVCELLPKAVVSARIVPRVRALVADQSQHVRAALASVIGGLAPIIGKEETTTVLVELIVKLLKDEVAEVRLNVISKIKKVNEVAGIEGLVSSLLPAIFELAKDRQWRIRLEIIQFIPLLAAELGPAFFDDKLSGLCMSWLTDNVFAIREAAIVNVRKMAETFGIEWTQANIIPSILSLHSHPNYLHRMTTLFAISALSAVVGPRLISDSLLPLVLRMAQDKVANIRFNVAKTLQALIPQLDAATVQQRVKPCLQKLAEDPDRDVKFYAGQSLALCV